MYVQIRRDPIKHVVAVLAGCKTARALIAAVAQAAYQVICANRDMNFLVEVADADHLHAVSVSFAYDCQYDSEGAAHSWFLT